MPLILGPRRGAETAAAISQDFSVIRAVKLGAADVFIYVLVTLGREEIDWVGLRAAAVAPSH